MTKDYKPTPHRSANARGSSFFSGLLIGLLLGVGASVALTLYLKGDSNPFLMPQENHVENKASPKKQVQETVVTKQSPDQASMEDPNKFDFYTILPESESKVTEQEVKSNATIKQDAYFLQIGAFENVDDADNMKAKLALQGFEAVVQTAEIPEKGTWHRVRVGPLSDVEQINKVRADLSLNGFNADLIKVHTEATTD